MSFAEYADLDGLGLAERVRRRDVSARELLDAAIERIERHNGVLNAVVYKAYDEARTVADGPLPDGPFQGVPFLIKDLGVRVKNWPRNDRAIGFSVDHVVSRTVRDSAAMLDATGAPQPASPYAPPPKERPFLEEVARSPGKLSIAWSGAAPSGAPLDADVAAALECTAETLKALGHDVRHQDLDLDWRLFYKAQGIVSATNFSANIKRWVEIKGREPGDDEIEGLARRAYEAGKKITGQDAMWAWQQLRLMNREILQQFETWDVFLTPVMITPPPRVEFLDTLMEDLKEFDRRQSITFGFTPPFNITGQPSLSLPLAQSQSRLPIGMMFTGRYGDEAKLFRLAGQLEKEMPWKDRKPPVWG